MWLRQILVFDSQVYPDVRWVTRSLPRATTVAESQPDSVIVTNQCPGVSAAPKWEADQQ